MVGSLHHVLETLEGSDLDDVACRFGGSVLQFAGEGVLDVFLRLDGGLADPDDFHEAGNGECPGSFPSADFGLNDVDEGVEDFADLSFVESGLVSNLRE